MAQVQLEKEEKTVFQEVVEEDPGVCENCFRRTHQVEEDWAPNQERLVTRGYDGHFHSMDASDRQEKFSDKRFSPIDENVEKVYPERREAKGAPKGRNVCERCGILDSSKIRPVSKSDAIQFTLNLIDRLEEAEESFDEDVLFTCVKRLKERPDHQALDDDIFAASVKVAIRYGDNNGS